MNEIQTVASALVARWMSIGNPDCSCLNSNSVKLVGIFSMIKGIVIDRPSTQTLEKSIFFHLIYSLNITMVFLLNINTQLELQSSHQDFQSIQPLSRSSKIPKALPRHFLSIVHSFILSPTFLFLFCFVSSPI